VTTAQRSVLLVAGVVAILMLVFPPWETPGGHYLGHSSIASPPTGDDFRPETHRWAFPSPEPLGRVSLSILAAQYAALWVCAGAAFLLLSPSRRP
jgi:hypothetical protein